MNYLCVMPRMVNEPGDGYYFMLGIAYVSGALKAAGFNVFALNLNHRAGEIKDILREEIEAHEIDAVLCGGLSFQFGLVESVLRAVKEIDPLILTIAGGGLITADPEAAMQALQYADIGVIGEGEVTIIELAHLLNNDMPDFKNLPGIIFNSAGAWVISPLRPDIDDIDSIPFPDYEGFGISEYLKISPSSCGVNDKNTIFFLTSRSCPYRCTFCFHPTGHKYRVRSLDSIFAELDWLTSRHIIHTLYISDELFSDNIERVREFCKRIKPYGIQWQAQFSARNITPELIDILKDGGCVDMTFGVESADNTILKSMRKGLTIEKITDTLEMVHKKGMALVGSLIFGDIAETRETAQHSIDWAIAHPEYGITLAMIRVFPGTYIYKYACENGLIRDRVKFLRDGCPQINISKMNDTEFSEVIQLTRGVLVNQYAKLKNVTMTHLDAARFDIAGDCVKCGKRNLWQAVNVLRPGNYLSCRYCGQSHPVYIEQRADIETNVKQLIERYGKLAVWGVNYIAIDLFKHSKALRDARIYPIDISENVQKSKLFGRRIYSPDVIRDENIPAVIIALPHYYTLISGTIRDGYPGVQPIDICSLFESRPPNKLEAGYTWD